MKNRYLLLLLSPILFFMACGDSSQADETADPSKCKFGTPVAIFSAKHEPIKTHSFQSKGNSGIEILSFGNGKSLEIIQSGCNDIKQELTFKLAPNQAEDWLSTAVNELDFLGNISEEYKAFSFWAGAIDGKKEAFKLGQNIELEPNIFANIDRISSSDHTLLKITLSQKS